jgi:iron(III) transport system permease protein
MSRLRRWLHRHDLTPASGGGVTLIWLFFALFLAFPLAHVFLRTFIVNGRFSLQSMRLMFTDPIYRECIVNSLNLGFCVTVVTTVIALPMAFVVTRYRFPGKTLFSSLLLVPMIMPPFVGAIGMKQLFARFGSVNLALMNAGLIRHPVDWFGGGFCGVLILEALHLYPIMYLNVAAAMANIDPSLEEAAQNLGARPWRLFRTVTFPLLAPGYFAGAVIVFIWAFTDLGTPLIFEYRNVVPVQIFDQISDIQENPMGFAFVVLVILVTMACFYLAKRHLGGTRFEMMARGHVGDRERPASAWGSVGIITLLVGITFVAVLPHLSVILTSLAQRWFMTPLPQEWSFVYYRKLAHHELTGLSIRNSLLYSSISTVIDLALGVTIAYLLARRKFPGRDLLDATAMLPLALPGLVLAFGYLGCFAGWPLLDARKSPVILLVVAYSVRRLPYAVRAAYAGLQQTSVTLEEASQNLGASPWRTIRKITLPLVYANVIAGGVLAFAFAMLEVSDSLVLAQTERYYPITRAIYDFVQRIYDGPFIASAMGVLGMILLTISLLIAGRVLGKRMGALFRA